MGLFQSRWPYRHQCAVCRDWFNTPQAGRWICDPCLGIHPPQRRGNGHYTPDDNISFHRAVREIEDGITDHVSHLL